MIFQENFFSCYALLTDQIPLSDCSFTSWDIGQYVWCSYWFMCIGCEVLNFKVNLSNQIVFLPYRKVKTKIWEQEEILRWNEKVSASKNCLRPEDLPLSKYFTCSLIATFCFAHVEHFWTCLEGIYIIIDNNYKLLIMFQRVDVYLNESIKIEELIKLPYQSIQRRTRDRNDKDNNNFYFWKKKIS